MTKSFCASRERGVRESSHGQQPNQNIPRQSSPPAKTLENLKWWMENDRKIAEEIRNGEW